MRPMPARIGLALVAVLALGWLGIMLRDAISLQDAGNVLFRQPPPPRAELDRALKQMKDSNVLNPDPTGDIDRARFLLLNDRPRAALTLADQVVADEPDNLNAWSVVFQAGSKVDPARAAAAKAAILRLDPQAAKRAG